MKLLLVVQSCLTLCNPMDYRLPASSVQGIPLEQEYWIGLPFSSPGHLSNPGIEPSSPALQVGSLPSEPFQRTDGCQFNLVLALITQNWPRPCRLGTQSHKTDLISSTSCKSLVSPIKQHLLSIQLQI